MRPLVLFTFLLTAFISSTAAQPPVDWIRTYDIGGCDIFTDIYRVPNDGYALCGYTYDTNGDRRLSCDMWIVRIEENGELIWSLINGLPDSHDALNSIIETDQGNFLAGGRLGGQFAAILVNRNGEEIWTETYGNGECSAVIELKRGEFLLAGMWREDRTGAAVLIDAEGDVLWDESYGQADTDRFKTMRETEGGIVLGGYSYFRNQPPHYRAWILKTDFDGEELWSNYISPYTLQMGVSMVSVPNGGFAFTGRIWEVDGDSAVDFGLFMINDQGDLEWSRRYDIRGQNREDIPTCIARLSDGEFVLVGFERPGLIPIAQRVRSNGLERWHSLYNFEDNENLGGNGNIFYSVLEREDNSIIAAGRITPAEGNGGRDGFVMKLEPEVLEPQFITWTPQDTILTVLVGDTIDFSVGVNDDQEDETGVFWVMGEDTLSHNDSVQVAFEELGEYEVRCFVTDQEFTVSIGWHITAVEWYMDMFQPDSTEFAVRRGTSIDFTHHSRAIDEREFEYRWEHFGRGGNFEIDGEDSIRFIFDLSGEHIIRAVVMSDDEIRTVSWDVSVHSIIWWWWPHELQISAYQDTTIVFEVFPFNEESDSLEYTWYLNNEVLDCDSSSVEIHFLEINEYEITAFATEGIEADTIRWTVEVLERSFTAGETDSADLLTTPMLYPASPNPFNSSTTIKYFIPNAGPVNMKVFDTQGRLTATIENALYQAGTHQSNLNAAGLSAGVYLIHFQAHGFSTTKKILVMK